VDGLDDLIEGYQKERKASYNWRDYGEGNRLGGGDDDDGTAKAPKVGLRKDGAVLSH